MQASLLNDILTGKIPVVYSKEFREWASLIQSNVSATEALRARSGPQGSGSTIRALMVEMTTGGQPSPQAPTQQITEKLWDDIDKQAAKMRHTLPAIIDIESRALPDILIDDEPE